MNKDDGKQDHNGPISKVLVVGGGIAGIQASLDLANSGFKVFLVENQPSIGGVMAQLDKTFPTNDCSMCILSPKLVDAGRHPNIDVITYSSVEKVDGSVGHFKIMVRKHARYVDIDACKSCNDCVDVCPVLRPNLYEHGLCERHAIYQLFPQANPSAYVIEKTGTPPCKAVCPIHVNAQGYIALIAAGKYHEAYTLIRQKNPFLGITGRICTRPCEAACRRGDADEPIAIDYLKRFVDDHIIADEIPLGEKASSSGKNIAIIGSGPAGLLAAYDLAMMGHAPTIFESLPVAGGMLAVGIPAYRLPRDVLQREINLVQSLGVQIKTNTTIGKDISLSDLQRKYDAVFIAIGAHVARQLNIPGETLDGVVSATDFLKKVNLKTPVPVGRNIVVIGGGDAAVDAARTALRLAQQQHGKDVSVSIIYRRSREEMPAQPTEVTEAEHEGIHLLFLTRPIHIHGSGGSVCSLVCQKMQLGDVDQSGRKRPIPVQGSEFQIPVDMVLSAIGQTPDLSHLVSGTDLVCSEGGLVKVDPVTLQTNLLGVFAGGDAVTGPWTYIEAMAAGRKAAISIDRFVSGKDVHGGRDNEGPSTEYVEVTIDGVVQQSRLQMNTLPLPDRHGSFTEVEQPITEQEAVAEANRCLQCGGCCECLQCVEACEPKAIHHDMHDESIIVDVGAIILAPGFSDFDARIKHEFGYGRFPNVISSIEFERILSASGPFGGHVVRPSDEQEPKRVAWIQCVGSRDVHINKGYCSSVCCMYAVKEAVIAKEHAPNIEPTIFYMDLRTFGKDFDQYVSRAQQEYGVRFIASRISCIQEDSSTHDLVIKYESEEGRLCTEMFELVVLSTGVSPPHDADALAQIFGISLNQYDFAETQLFTPLSTSKQGVFVAGTFQGPKDIPETVAQASGAAALAGRLLAGNRERFTVQKQYPPEIDVWYQPPRVGVFICHCGKNIGGYVNVASLVEQVKCCAHVVYAEENLFTCSQDTQNHIKEMIREHDLNRVVVASCTPRTHEPLFQDTMKEVGLNPYLFEMANIRDQCSWVHMKQPEEATEKAYQLVHMAVAKAALLQPLPIVQIPVHHTGLVIGGGVAGLTAALGLADQGFDVVLVEKEHELGGHLRTLTRTLQQVNPQLFFADLIRRVQAHHRISVFTQATIENISGYVGNFKTRLQCKDKKNSGEIDHGIIIVATGAETLVPNEYLYGEDSRVVTQEEFEQRMSTEPLVFGDNENVVMIQCVGSRDDVHPYCSRVCCATAVKNALEIKEQNQKTNVYIVYRDMRTYGFAEDYYQKAREHGIMFIRYSPEKKPVVEKQDDQLVVKVFEPLLGEELEIYTAQLVLSTGMVPAKDNERLSQLLKVPLNADGFFLEAHAKLRPVDFATEGIFLAGLAHSPKAIDETIVQAYAAVSRACTILSKEVLELPGKIAVVSDTQCTGCGLCVSVCAYQAIELVLKPVKGMEKMVAQVNEALCKGCGACVGACFSGAIQHKGFTDKQILSMIKSLRKNS